MMTLTLILIMLLLTLTCFLIMAVIVVLCWIISFGWCATIMYLAMGATPELWKEFAGFFMTFDGFILLIQLVCMCGGAALYSLYFSLPLSVVVVAIYCLWKWLTL